MKVVFVLLVVRDRGPFNLCARPWQLEQWQYLLTKEASHIVANIPLFLNMLVSL